MFIVVTSSIRHLLKLQRWAVLNTHFCVISTIIFFQTILHLHNPSDRTMALGSTQPLTEMSSRNFFWWVKAAGA